MKLLIYEIVVFRLGLYGVLRPHLEITWWMVSDGMYLDIGKYI